MIHLVRRHQKDDEVADRRKMSAPLLVRVGLREHGRIHIRKALCDPRMLLSDDAQELVLAREEAFVWRGVPPVLNVSSQPAGKSELTPSSRPAALAATARWPSDRRVIHHSVRLRAHLVVREVGDGGVIPRFNVYTCRMCEPVVSLSRSAWWHAPPLY